MRRLYSYSIATCFQFHIYLLSPLSLSPSVVIVCYSVCISLRTKISNFSSELSGPNCAKFGKYARPIYLFCEYFRCFRWRIFEETTPIHSREDRQVEINNCLSHDRHFHVTVVHSAQQLHGITVRNTFAAAQGNQFLCEIEGFGVRALLIVGERLMLVKFAAWRKTEVVCCRSFRPNNDSRVFDGIQEWATWIYTGHSEKSASSSLWLSSISCCSDLSAAVGRLLRYRCLCLASVVRPADKFTTENWSFAMWSTDQMIFDPFDLWSGTLNSLWSERIAIRRAPVSLFSYQLQQIYVTSYVASELKTLCGDNYACCYMHVKHAVRFSVYS